MPTSTLENTLATLKHEGVITYYRIEDDGEKAVISLRVAYLNDDPNVGYDGETEARGRKIGDALGECGLHFHDAGCEDGGEYWIFRA